LIGREPELARIERELRSGVRLLSVTGAGGSGKTRLALQAAADLTEEFPGGTYFVPLAPLAEAASMRAAVAAALELQPDDDITARLDARPSLLVIDNAEHLPGIELEIAKLRIGKTALLVTSRSRLRLSGERELPLEPLPEDDALELFRARAAALGYAVPVDDVSRMICRRLDNLPLALELAAARLVVLSPVALLERLDRALPLLSDGPRDVDDRQRTLRATIEWSFRLLSGGGQRALRRLAAFRGGFTLDAARAVAGADIGLIAELADQSLIRRVGDDRYLMLETIREFGLEVEDADLAPAHAAYYLERVRANDREVRGPRMGALLAWQRSEAENIWAALDALVDGGREDDAWDLARLMHFYWQATGSVRRATEWLRRRLAQTESRTPAWIGASIALADLLDSLGSIDEARAVLDGVEAAALAAADARGLAGLHKVRHFVALSSRDLEAALAHAQVELEYARLLDERSRLFAEFHLAAALFELRQLEQAETILKPLLDAFASEGDLFNETGALHLLANVSFELGRYDAAAAYLDRTLRHLRTMDARGYLPVALTARGFYAMAQDRREEARRAFAEALSIAREDGVDYELCELVDHIAVLVATDDRPAAGSLYSTVGVRRAALGTPRLDRDLPIYAHVLGGAELVGDVIPWEDAISLAQSLVERSLD
jgi:predicted ATPase